VYQAHIFGEAMEIKYRAEVSVIFIFADKKYSQTDPNYYKILIDENKCIIKKELSAIFKTPEDCLQNLYNNYIKIDYDWPTKYLANCRRVKNIIEITYLCKLPMLEGCYKMGRLINISDFLDLKLDEYYVKIISSNSPESFR
jgi:hypothetical protein